VARRGRPLVALQRKIETYAAFVATGALDEYDPQAEGKRVEIHLHYPDEPDPAFMAELE
jgi:hypothetical protein